MASIQRLKDEMIKTDSLVCVGLDPIIDLMPTQLKNNSSDLEEMMFHFLAEVIDLTAESCCAYKIQKAFFDIHEFGLHLLKDVVAYIKKNHSKKTVIIDCKIGDVEHTMSAYTQNIFGNIRSDGIVVNPFMGEDIYNSFSENRDNLFIVLVRTSNKGAQKFQDLLLHDSERLWMHILKSLVQKWNESKNIIPVLSLDTENDSILIRKLIPDEMPIFWAGFGIQGKDIQGMKWLLDMNGYGVLVNSSRGILYANYELSTSWKDAIRMNVIEMKMKLNNLKPRKC